MINILQTNTDIAIDTHENTEMFSATAYYKYLIDIGEYRFLATLNSFWHTKIINKAFLVFAILCVTVTDLKAVPIMQESEYIISYDDAVNQLFYKKSLEDSEVKEAGHQTKNTYTMSSPENEWFVKTTREDCHSCHDTSYDDEWPLKDNQEKINIIKTANAELILPKKRSTFMLENKKHLSVSYPWIPGKTLEDVYKDHFLGNETPKTLKRAMYRYGQVLAIAALDQNNPSDDITELLNRAPQVSLDDRTGQNVKYYGGNDKIYLFDLSIIDPKVIASDTVKK